MNNDPTVQPQGVDAQSNNLEASITALGAVILKMKMDGDVEDKEKLDELEERFSRLKSEYEALEREQKTHAPTQHPSDDENDDLRQTMHKIADYGDKTWEQVSEKVRRAYEDMNDFATDQRNIDAFKGGAKDIGSAFAQAWRDVSKGFENAYGRWREDKQSQQEIETSKQQDV